MRQKKIIINITVIALAFLLFTVWYRNSIEIATLETSFLRHYKVYLITTDKQQYWEYMNNGAAIMANAIGIDYIWEAPEVPNVNAQIQIINSAVENGANAIMIAADDPKLISTVVEDAKAKGVKVIYVDSPAYEEAITTLATDNYEAGVLAGQTMISVLDNMDINKGAIGIISITAKENSEQRDRGLRSVMQKDGRYKVLDTVYTNGNVVVVQNEAERLMKENSDLISLYGTNARTTEGVGRAIAADNNRLFGIGFDDTDNNLELLHNGSLKALVIQNPFTMGYLGMAQAIAAILGRDTGPYFINTGASVRME